METASWTSSLELMPVIFGFCTCPRPLLAFINTLCRKGTDGKLVDNYPVKLKGRIMSQLLLLDAERDGGKGMHIVVHSLDGHVYIIEGPSGCSDKIDIGEPSFSMVLADDLTGNGLVDLLVTTKSGNIYCLGTSISFHPSQAWYARTNPLSFH